MKRLSVVFIGIATVIALLMAAMATPAYALTTGTWNGKGAVAEWSIGSTIIQAVLRESESGKNGLLDVSITHFGLVVSKGTATVNFQWNMDHITVTATGMTFTGEGPYGIYFTGPHEIKITLQAQPKSQGNTPGTTDNGMTINVEGSWKAADAGIWIDGNNKDNHDNGGLPFMSETAYIVHGNIAIT